MILTVLVVIALTIALAIIIHHLLYVREVRHLPMISELQARANAAPLTSAVTHPEDHAREL